MHKPSKKMQNMLWIGLGLLVIAGIAVGIYFAVKGKSSPASNIPNPSPNGPPSGGGGTIVGPVTPPNNNVKEININQFSDLSSGAIFNNSSNLSNASLYLKLKSATSTKGNTNKPFVVPLIAFGQTDPTDTVYSNIIVLTNKISQDISPTNQLYVMNLYFIPVFKKTTPMGSPVTIERSLLVDNWDNIVSNIYNSPIYIQQPGIHNKDFGITVNIVEAGTIPYNSPLGIVISQIGTNSPSTINSIFITNNSSTYYGFKNPSQLSTGFNPTIYTGPEIINSSEYHYELASNTALQLVTGDSNENNNFIQYALSQPLS